MTILFTIFKEEIKIHEKIEVKIKNKFKFEIKN